MGILNSWIDDLPQQFQGKQHIEALISAFSRQLEELHGVFKQLDTETDLESAVGKNLDMVGDIVSLTRKEAGLLMGIGMEEPVISDDRYRKLLRYKVLRDTSDCTYNDIMQSIQILWKTDNIEYFEDPDRPATILIKLRTMNVDSEVDPALGKTLAVKPAGVALVYTINYIVIVENHRMERFFFPRMRMCVAISFWQNRMFDGSWLLDGFSPLNAKRYEARAGMKTFDVFKIIELAGTRTVKTSFHQIVEEMVDLPVAAVYFRIGFFGLVQTDELRNYAVLKMDVETKEGFGFSLTERKNLWYLDASLKLDGSNILNAKIEKGDF